MMTDLQNIWLEIGDRMDEGGLAALAPAERPFAIVCELRDEVCNGGLEQYLLNSSGTRAALAADALRDVGAAELADLLEQTWTETIGEAPARNRSEREGQVEGLDPEAFDAFDDAFYAQAEELEQLLGAYARDKLTKRTTV